MTKIEWTEKTCLTNRLPLGKKHTGRLLDGVEYSEYPNSEIAKGEIAK
jgi:hypothetical protein